MDSRISLVINRLQFNIMGDQSISLKGSPLVSETSWRWVALILIGLSRFGVSFCLDLPMALQTHIMTDLKISTTEFSISYFSLFITDCFFSMIGGIFAQKYGLRKGYTVFFTLNIVAQILLFVSGVFLNFPMMILSRFFFGMGLGSTSSMGCALINHWFGEKEKSFGLASFICISRLGSLANNFLTPHIYNWTGSLKWPFLSGVLCIAFSFLSFLGFSAFDLKKERQEEERNSSIGKTSLPDTSSKTDDSKTEAESPLDESPLIERSTKKEGFKLRNMKEFPFVFYIYLAYTFFAYGFFLVFMEIQNEMIMVFYGWSNSQAGDLLSVYYLISTPMSLVFGMAVGKWGGRQTLVLISALLIVIMQVYLRFFPNFQREVDVTLFPIVLFGFFYALHSGAFMGTVAMTIPKKYSSVGFGIVLSFVSIATAASSLIAGYVVDLSASELEGYRNVSLYFLGLGAICTFLALTGIAKGTQIKEDEEIKGE